MKSQKREISSVEAGSNTSTVALRVVGGDEKGSFESETVNYGHKSHGSRTRKYLHYQGPGAIVNDRPVLSSERESAPHQQTSNCLDSNKKSGRKSQMGALFQDILADGRNMTLTSMEAGSNTSTVALRVVGGDEKGTQCLGGITGPLCTWGI
jgi:hypothetical protein